MPLKIVRATDPLKTERVTLVIYGQPGIGKTTAAYSASKPLLLDFDKGSARASLRGDSVQVAAWEEVSNLTANDVAGYETLIVDTAGRMIDAITVDMIKRDPKMGRGAGEPSLQGWGRLRGLFRGWLNRVQQLGLDVVILAHSEEQRSDDEVTERLDVAGGSKKLIYQEATAMASYRINGRQRVLQFAPTAASYGKDPAGLGQVTVPNISETENADFLAVLIMGIKTELNARAAGKVQATPAPVPQVEQPEPQADLGALPYEEGEDERELDYPEGIIIGATLAGIDYDVYQDLTERVQIGAQLSDEDKTQLKADLVTYGLGWNKTTKRLEKAGT